MGSEQGPAFYDAHIAGDIVPLAQSPYREVYEAAASLVPSVEDAIADVGCGTGRFAQLLYQKGCRNYWGVDFSPARVEEARRAVPEFEFSVADVFAPEVAERLKKFRVFCILEVLEHLMWDRRLLAALPPGSAVVFSVPNFDSAAHVRQFESIKSVHDRYGDLLDFSSGEIRACPCKVEGAVIWVMSARRRAPREAARITPWSGGAPSAADGGAAPPAPPKVAMLVLNSVRSDARVQKEAGSLAAAGFDVTVIGLAEGEAPRSIETTAGDWQVIRVPWGARKVSRAARMRAATPMAAGGLMLLLALWTVGALTYGLPEGAPKYVLLAPVWAFLAIGGLAALRAGFRRLRRVGGAETAPGRPHPDRGPGRPQGLVALLGKAARVVFGLSGARIIRKLMLEELARLKPQVVHCHDLSTLPIGCAYKKRSGCQVVYDSHEIFEQTSLLDRSSRWLNTRLQRASSRHVDGFITVNDSIAAYLGRKYPRLPRPVVVMNAVEPQGLAAYDGRLHWAIGERPAVVSAALKEEASLAGRLASCGQGPGPSVESRIWHGLSPGAREWVMRRGAPLRTGKTQNPSEAAGEADSFLADMAEMLGSTSFYDKAAWQGVVLCEKLRGMLAEWEAGGLTGFEQVRMNLLLLRDAFPDAVSLDLDVLRRTKRILLYQGGLARWRGLDAAVRAAPSLPPEWVLVMMGGGRYEQVLRRVAAEVDPQGERVRFIPAVPRDELVRWTQGASLGLVPYENVCLNHWYCTPNKLWEYPAAGVPILASPFPEIRKIVEGRGVGWLVDDRVTPEGIARAVSLLTDEELEAKRANCLRFVQQDNWSVYEARLTRLYADLLGDEGRSRPPAERTASSGR